MNRARASSADTRLPRDLLILSSPSLSRPLCTQKREKGWWPVVVLILASSLLAVIYIWKVVEVAYFKSRPEGAAAVSEVAPAMLIPIWVLVGANFYFGINTDLSVGTAMAAAKALIGGAP